MALDPEFKAAWVKALRENKHRQCYGALWDGQGNACALGVAYELLGIRSYEELNQHGPHPTIANIPMREQERIASCMNDGQRQPLDIIAAYIEQNL